MLQVQNRSLANTSSDTSHQDVASLEKEILDLKDELEQVKYYSDQPTIALVQVIRSEVLDVSQNFEKLWLKIPTPSAATLPYQLMQRDLTERSLTDQTLTERSLTDRSLTDRSLTERSLTERSLTERSLTDRSLTDTNY